MNTVPSPELQAKPTRPVLRYYGGKWHLAPRLVALFPPHHIYTEVFGGGASVLMHKDRSAGEIYNDLDGEVVNVFRVLQNRARARRLEELLRVTPFARAEFVKSYRPVTDPVESARRTIMRSFMGFASDSITATKGHRAAGFNTVARKTTGFRANSWRSHVSAAMDWAHYPDHVSAFTHRLRGVVIENRSAHRILEKSDSRDTLHYVDPPYPLSVRNRDHNYIHELTEQAHRELSELVHTLRGMVIISSYPGELYEELYADWHRISWTGFQFCHNSLERTESVWLNPAAVSTSRQQQLFT